MYMFATSDSPSSERASFRNSETQVPQFGEMKRRNSGLSSLRNLADVIFPSFVVRDISGIFSTLIGPLALFLVQDEKSSRDVKTRPRSRSFRRLESVFDVLKSIISVSPIYLFTSERMLCLQFYLIQLISKNNLTLEYIAKTDQSSLHHIGLGQIWADMNKAKLFHVGPSCHLSSP